MIAIKSNLNGKCKFEGLTDVSTLPDGTPAKYFDCVDSINGRFCVISGRYQEGQHSESLAIAIGLWDEERKLFSNLTKTKDGASLPLPFRVTADKEALQKALQKFEQSQRSLTAKALARLEKDNASQIMTSLARLNNGKASLTETIKLYNEIAKENQ